MPKKIKEISSLGKDELNKKLMELKKELIKLNAQVATGTTLKNPASIGNTKKMIARILMLLNQKEIEEKIMKKPEVKKA